MIATHNGWSLMCPCMLSLNTLLESATFMMTSRRKTMLRKRRESGRSKTNGHNINSLIRAEDEGSSQQDQAPREAEVCARNASPRRTTTSRTQNAQTTSRRRSIDRTLRYGRYYNDFSKGKT